MIDPKIPMELTALMGKLLGYRQNLLTEVAKARKRNITKIKRLERGK